LAIERVRRLGVYAPLSATYYQDDDIADAGEAAELLYVRGLAFCAGRPSDGFISDTQVVRFVGVGMGDALDRAETLVKVGAWERVDGGFVVRSWLKWNKSAEELGQDRTRDRDRKRKQAEERFDGSPGVADQPIREGVLRADRSADSADPELDGSGGIHEDSARNPQESLPNTMHFNSLHDTSLTNLPDEPASETELDDAEILELGETLLRSTAEQSGKDHADALFAEFWTAYPRSVDKGHARKAWNTALKNGVEPRAMINGAINYRDDPKRPREHKYIPYPSTWINGERWTDSPDVIPPPRGKTFWGDN
jgi:hypothetical protein